MRGKFEGCGRGRCPGPLGGTGRCGRTAGRGDRERRVRQEPAGDEVGHGDQLPAVREGPKERDVMFATGRFGLITYDLADPAHPRMLDTLDNEALRLTGDPPVDTRRPDATISTYWQNEDMDVDQDRKLVFMARDPRSFGGTTASTRASPASTSSTLRDPADIKLITFHQLPTGHTTTCINDCDYLWTGGPASAAASGRRGRAGARSSSPTSATRGTRQRPRSRSTCSATTAQTAYSHDVQVDAAGHRLGLRPGRRARLLDRGQALRPAPGRQARGDGDRPDPLRRRRFDRRGHAVGSSCTTRSGRQRRSADGPRPGQGQAGLS